MSRKLFRLFSRIFSPRPTQSPIIKRKKPVCKKRIELETLEGRIVPTGMLVSSVLGGTSNTRIEGTVYEDADANGVRSGGENGVSGWTVYLDLDQSGTLNTDAEGVAEPSALTDKDGNYSIRQLMPGTYRLAEVVQAGWAATAPVSQDLVVALDRTTRADFFNFSGGDVVGTVWNDVDGDGNRATDPTTGAFTEPGLAGWTVFLDINNNRAFDDSEPSTLTDEEGSYTFVNLPPGDYEVTEVLPDGWEASKGYDIRQTAAVQARTQFTQDFANFSLINGSVSGTIWNDANNDGVRNTDAVTGAFTEPGLEGWTVFLDLNHNGAADAGELTATTDASGRYAFVSVAAGAYEVVEVVPSGWDISSEYAVRQFVTVTGGEATKGVDFADFTVLNGSIRGTVWNDLNRNGIRDVSLAGVYTDSGLPNWSVYLDLNDNGVADSSEPRTLTDANGEYAFADLQVGEYRVAELIPTGWETAPAFDDNQPVWVYSGTESVAPDFANFNLAAATPGSVRGVVWNDFNGNGIRNADASTGAFVDTGLAGWTVFVDANLNGVLDTGETSADTAADGGYTLSGLLPGSITVIEQFKPGWRATAPVTAKRTIALKNGENATGLDFGNWALQDSAIRGAVYADSDKDGVRDAGERGIEGVTVYLDLNSNGLLDTGEPSTATSADQFFTPGVDEAGSYNFTHLAAGTYTVRQVVPTLLSATPAREFEHLVTLAGAEGRGGVDFADIYRPTEIHGVKFDDSNGNHSRDDGEAGVAGVTVYVDLDRDDTLDAGEPTSVTAVDGSYTFTDLAPGAYVVREIVPSGYEHTYPTTRGGTLWPDGVSNPAQGIVTPTSINASLATGQSYRETISLTLPNTGALTNMVDVFLLFDDTGSFVNNSPIVRGAFPDIIAQLQSALPGIDLGFGVGRFEEYANFASEYATGRPFVLNQPIVAASAAGYMTAIQSALNRTTPGYGGDQPETDIEALYQLVTGLGFDGNNNGSVLDSGAAGLASTQLSPGTSGDVPSFASFKADAANGVMAAAGNVGGGGFRAGALPIILVATDTGFAFQPKGETVINGVGGVSLPISALAGTSRPTTPFNSGAGIQETITGLNALGALVIGLGTNPQANLDPRQGLESLSKLTGAVNRSTTIISNGTADPIAPGDPLYFQIASGFASSVASGVTNAIQNAVTNVAVDITIQASDPRVKIVNHTGVRNAVGSGQTATFDIEFVGDGVPHRFDLQFVRNGTNVVLGSIPVLLGTPIPGNCYEFEDLSEGEIREAADFGSHIVSTTTTTPTIAVVGGSFTYDSLAHTASASATGLGGATVGGTFTFTYNGSASVPTAAGVYSVVANFKSSDSNYSDATGSATLTISATAPTVTVSGGAFTYDSLTHAATAIATGISGAAVGGTFTFTYNGSASVPTAAGVYSVVVNFKSSDSNYSDSTGSATLTISATAPTVTVSGGAFTYDSLTHAATAIATGISGATVGGAFTFTYNGSASVPTAAGVYSVVANFKSSDSNYSDATGSATLIISAASPTVTVSGGAFTYDRLTHAATAIATGIGGVTVGGSSTFTYNGSASLPINAGTYVVLVSFISGDANYSAGSASGTLVIDKATPSFGNLSSPAIDVGTASVTLAGRLTAGAVIPNGDAIEVTFNGVVRSTSVDGSGAFSLSVSTAGLAAGSYGVTFHYAGSANFNAIADGTSNVKINTVAHGIEAIGVNVSAIAGAPLSRTVATINNTLGGASAYAATISWGDGDTSAGIITGSGGTLAVVGSHTYADPGTANIRVTLVDTLGMGLSTTTTSVASVTSLGLAAGQTKEAEFWASRSGLNLLVAFNGGATHTELAKWLATNFPNLYGATAGINNLSGRTNLYVAAYFRSLWNVNGDGAATQVLTTALNVYATTASLGGTQGAAYGFKVSTTGHGARSFDVGRNGAVVGVPNNNVLNVFEMLKGVDKQAKKGVLFGGDRSLLSGAKKLFDRLNSL